MLDVMKKLNELANLLQVKVQHYEAERGKAAAAETEAKALKQGCDERAKALDEREKALDARKIKVARLDALDAGEKALADAKTALAIEREDWEKKKAAQEKALSEGEAALKMRLDKVVSREKQLDENERTLEKRIKDRLLSKGLQPIGDVQV